MRRSIIVVLLWAVVVGGAVVLGSLELRAAATAGQDVRRNLDVADLDSDEPAHRLRQLADRSGRARRLIQNPVVAPATWLPIVGRQIRSLGAMAAAGEDLGVLGSAAATEARHVISSAPTTAADRLSLVAELRELLERVERDLDAIELGPDHALIGPLAARRAAIEADLREGVARAGGAAQAAAAVHELLAGPSRYLLLAANNAEMRAGSGTFLTAAQLTAEGGSFSLGATERTAELALPGEGLPIEGDLAARWGFTHPNREWRNLAPTPRFPVTAALAAQMWQAARGETVDGVLSVDARGLRAILEATGPVDVGGQRVDADNVEDYLLHDQYEILDDPDDRTEDQAARREQLGAIAQAATEALESGGYDAGELAQSLVEAAAGRHLMIWSSDPRQQRGWEEIGAAGTLRDDSLLVSVINRAGNKLDHFLRPAIDLRSEPAGDRTAFTLSISLHNDVDADEVAYVLGPARGIDHPPGTYIGFVSVNVPGAATGLAIDGAPSVVAGADGPTRVIAGQVVLERGGRATLTVRFTLPGTAGSLRLEPSARVPSSRWTTATDRFTDHKPRTLRWSRGRSVTSRA